MHFTGAVIVTAILLTGCANKIETTEPITSLQGRTCTAAPDFSHATVLQVDKEDSKYTTATVDGNAACFNDARGASAYAVFAIPPLSGQYTIQVSSIPANPALFAVRILLFDKDGTLKRTIQEKQITYRGLALSAVFRNHDDEQFLVVASDPSVTGNSDNRISGNTNVTTICTMYGCFSSYSGSEAVTNVVLAHNGKLSVGLIPIPPAKK
jgi:hypothetical protein